MKAIQMLMSARQRPRVYGYLYNWFVVDNIAATGWRVPSRMDYINMLLYVGGVYYQGQYLYAGGIVKGIRTSPLQHPRWTSPNTGAVDTYKLTIYSCGWRLANGGYSYIGNYSAHWASTQYDANNGYYITNDYSNDTAQVGGANFSKKIGASIRLCRNATVDELDIENELYIPELTVINNYYEGNDNTKYKCVRIDSLIWLTENLQETKYNSGTDIPIVTDNSSWAALTTGARCVYNNDENYI